MSTKISSMLDAVADRLEAKGLIKEAYEVDKIADGLDKERQIAFDRIRIAFPKDTEQRIAGAKKLLPLLKQLKELLNTTSDIEQIKKLLDECNNIDEQGTGWYDSKALKSPFPASTGIDGDLSHLQETAFKGLNEGWPEPFQPRAMRAVRNAISYLENFYGKLIS